MRQKEAMARAGANPKTHRQYGLESATRLHEAGIASNRGSAHHGEYVLESCTHRPSSQGSREYPTSAFIAAYGKFGNKD